MDFFLILCEGAFVLGISVREIPIFHVFKPIFALLISEYSLGDKLIIFISLIQSLEGTGLSRTKQFIL